MGGTIDCFYPLADYVDPFGTIRASSQRGGFQFHSGSILPSPLFKAWGVFNKITSISGTAVIFIMGGVILLLLKVCCGKRK